MSRDTELQKLEPTESRQVVVHHSVPSDGTIASGWTVQGNAESLTKVAQEEFRREIRARIEEDTRGLKVAKDVMAGTSAALTAVCSRIPVPEAMYVAVEAVTKAIRAFHPAATFARTDGNGNPVLLHPSAVSADRGEMTVIVDVAVLGAGSVFRASRVFPVPDEVRAAYAAHTAAVAKVAKHEARLTECRNFLAQANEYVRGMEARVIEHQLEKTAEGKKLLGATRDVVKLALEQLDQKRGES